MSKPVGKKMKKRARFEITRFADHWKNSFLVRSCHLASSTSFKMRGARKFRRKHRQKKNKYKWFSIFHVAFQSRIKRTNRRVQTHLHSADHNWPKFDVQNRIFLASLMLVRLASFKVYILIDLQQSLNMGAISSSFVRTNSPDLFGHLVEFF